MKNLLLGIVTTIICVSGIAINSKYNIKENSINENKQNMINMISISEAIEGIHIRNI